MHMFWMYCTVHWFVLTCNSSRLKFYRPYHYHKPHVLFNMNSNTFILRFWLWSINFFGVIKSREIPHFVGNIHDDVIKWKHFPRYWPFVRGIHRTPVKSPHNGQWRRTLMFSLICPWTNGWVNNRYAGDLRHHHTHYDATVMFLTCRPAWVIMGIKYTRDISNSVALWHGCNCGFK